MKWEQQDNDDGQRLLTIEAPWSELAADYTDIVARYAKVRLPGFRQGKVPKNVVEQRFRKEILDDLTHRAAQRLGREAMREAGIEPLGPVEAQEIECEKDKPFRFKVRFHPMPDFALPNIDSISIDGGKGDVRDEISHRLLELVSFKVPDELVKEELILDGIDGADPGCPEWKAATDRIRLMLILKRIARQEGIDVDEQDVNARIAEKAVEFGVTKESLQEDLAKGGGMQRLRDMLLFESTLGYLLEKAGTTRREGK